VLTNSVMPMLVRAYDDPDARMQEEVLRRTLSVTKQLDFNVTSRNLWHISQRIYSILYHCVLFQFPINEVIRWKKTHCTTAGSSLLSCYFCIWNSFLLEDGKDVVTRTLFVISMETAD
jgi:hypothetical protein